MAPHVTAVDLPVRWEPNAPEARLTANDGGEARLTLRAHPDDHDRRHVELIWTGCLVALMEAPNDEAVNGHRLSEAGMREVLWLGEVHESDLIADIERRNRVHPETARTVPPSFTTGSPR